MYKSEVNIQAGNTDRKKLILLLTLSSILTIFVPCLYYLHATDIWPWAPTQFFLTALCMLLMGYLIIRYPQNIKPFFFAFSKPNQAIHSDQYQQAETEESDTGSPQQQKSVSPPQLTDSLADPFFTLDNNYIITYCNPACANLTNQPYEHLVGKAISQIFSETEKNQLVVNIQQARKTQKAMSFISTKNIQGKELHFNNRINLIHEGVAVYMLDVTPQEQAKIEIQEEKDRLELIFNSAGLGTWDWHIQSGKVTHNDVWASLLGYRLEEMSGDVNDPKIQVHPDDISDIKSKIQLHLEGHTTIHEIERRVRTKDGQWIWTKDIGKLVERDEQGMPVRMVGITLNVHHKKELEAKLQEQKQQLEIAIQSANLGFWEWDLLSNTWYRNSNWYKMLGYTQQELAENPEIWKEITHPDEITLIEETLTNHLEGQTDFYVIEHRILHKEGYWLWARGSGKVIQRDSEGKPLKMIGLLQDLTFIKEQEIEIKRQKEQLELTLEAANLCTWEWHIPTNNVSFDRRWAPLTGFTAQNGTINITNWQDRLHPDDLPAITKAMQTHLEGYTDRYQEEVRIKTTGDTWYWILVNGKVVERDESGKPIRVMGIYTDIDTSKKMEEKLIQQKEQLELIIWAANLGTWDIDLNKDFSFKNVRFNALCAYMYGYSIKEFDELFVKEKWVDMYHPEDKERVLTALEKHLSGETPYFKVQHRTLTKDKQWKWIMNTGQVVAWDAEGKPSRFSGIQQDISEIKEAESSLYFFKNLVENSNDPAYSVDPHDGFKMTYVNDAACRHYKLSKEQLLSMRIHQWDPAYAKGDIMTIYHSLKKKKSLLFDTTHIIGTGESIPVEVTANLLVSEGKEYITGYFKNISERKSTEKKIKDLNSHLEVRVKERTAELAASNKELEAFSYSVSHDLRAPLRSIDGFSKALIEDYYDLLDEEGKDFLESIRNATLNMGVLIDEMLKLSRVTRLEIYKESTDLSAIAQNIIAELQKDMPTRSIRVNITSGIKVYADQKLMTIALQNLLENAWKFTSHTADPCITLGTQKHKDQVIYFIQDNGAGFDKNYVHKLFGAFQRLHHNSEFEGTGVGLATVQRIIHRHGGKIWAEGEIDQGATFYFTLD